MRLVHMKGQKYLRLSSSRRSKTSKSFHVIIMHSTCSQEMLFDRGVRYNFTRII